MSRIETLSFTKAFIPALADRIERDYLSLGKPLDRLAIIFGGKRPEQFLKRELARRIKGPFIPPRFYTIDEFIADVAGGCVAKEAALADAYEIYRLVVLRHQALLKGRSSFAEFLPWALDILNFIGELDIEDIDRASLKNIENSARIGYCVPESINGLLQEVLDLRETFHQETIANGRMTRGLLYRKAKEMVARYQPAFDEIIFANFFYFHRTEEAVAKDLYERGLATLLFQGDQRKWPVLERVAGQFKCELKEADAAPVATNFDLKAYCAPDVHTQAATVRNILNGITDLERTVVVLPDSSSLVPLLSAFPQKMENINVSMGYSLKRSSLYVLLQDLFRAQITRREGLYYSKDYLVALRHPLVKNLRLGIVPAVLRVLVHKIEEALAGRLTSAIAGKLFISLDEVLPEPAILDEAANVLQGMGIVCSRNELHDALAQLHQLLFTSWESVNSLRALSGSVSAFLDTMIKKSPMSEYPLNLNIAQELLALCWQWAQASFADEPFSQEELFCIFEDQAGRGVVQFKGTPLKGLQVLGLFETRSLNFDNVIVLDANEGVLPKVEENASLIPREVTAQLGIDRLKLDEEIQRYQFMRIISSAKTVHVVYQKNREKEASRFLEELVWEQQSRKGKLEPYPTQRVLFGVDVRAGVRRVKKTAKMLELLSTLRYSASSLNAYVKNPYDFYLRYVLRLREQEDLLDEPDAAQVGTFLHGFLEEAYKPLLGRPFEIDKLFEDHFKKLFDLRFEEFFVRRMRSDAFMVRTVMESKLHQFLEYEKERMAHVEKIEALEGDFPLVLDLPFGSVSLTTRVDRVDRMKDGSLMVLDYKTGSSDIPPKRQIDTPDVWIRQDVLDEIKSFQLPLYVQAVSQVYKGAAVNAGLYLLRDVEIKTLFEDPVRPEALLDELNPHVLAMTEMLREIRDPALDFIDDDLKKFDY